MTQLIWIFRELVVLLNTDLEEVRNVDAISDIYLINHELEQMKLYFLFSILSS